MSSLYLFKTANETTPCTTSSSSYIWYRIRHHCEPDRIIKFLLSFSATYPQSHTGYISPAPPTCSPANCLPPKQCQKNAIGLLVCQCPDNCPLESNPVCGSDGQTYRNLCALHQKSCTLAEGMLLRAAYQGPCSIDDVPQQVTPSVLPSTIVPYHNGTLSSIDNYTSGN